MTYSKRRYTAPFSAYADQIHELLEGLDATFETFVPNPDVGKSAVVNVRDEHADEVNRRFGKLLFDALPRDEYGVLLPLKH